MSTRQKVLFVFISILSFTYLYSASFEIVGGRPTALGGAYVSLAEDAVGVNYNPAGLAGQTKVDVEIPFAIGAIATKDLLKYARDAYNEGKDLNIGATASQLNTSEFAKATKFLAAAKKIGQENQGVIADVNGGLNLRFRNFALTANYTVMAAGVPKADWTNVSLFDNPTLTKPLTELDTFAKNTAGGNYGNRILSGDDLSLANSLAGIMTSAGISSGIDTQALANELVYQAKTNGISLEQMQTALPTIVQVASTSEVANTTTVGINNNNSEVLLNGVGLLEIGLSYGRQLFLPNLNFGISVKFMKGDVGFYKYTLQDSSIEMEDVKDNFDEDKKSSTTVGVDMGAIYTFGKLRMGLSAKNLNSPKFKNTAAAIAAGMDKEIKIEPQVRYGLSFKPWRRIILTSDIDLTENKTIMSNYKSRMLGAGFEMNLLPQEKKMFNIALRGGVKTNLAETDEGTIITAGLGFDFLHLQIDLAGSMSTKKTLTEDNDEIPSNFSVSGTVALNF